MIFERLAYTNKGFLFFDNYIILFRSGCTHTDYIGLGSLQFASLVKPVEMI